MVLTKELKLPDCYVWIPALQVPEESRWDSISQQSVDKYGEMHDEDEEEDTSEFDGEVNPHFHTDCRVVTWDKPVLKCNKESSMPHEMAENKVQDMVTAKFRQISALPEEDAE